MHNADSPGFFDFRSLLLARGRNAAATRRAPSPKPETNPKEEEIIEDEEREEEEPEPRSRDIEQYLKTLPADVVRQSLIYVYRAEPKIKSLGKNKYIAKYPGDAFSIDRVEEEFGGGKYKFFLDAHDEELSGEFWHDAPGELPPKINTIQFVMVDDNGQVLPWPVPGAAPAATPAREGTEAVIRAATDAASAGNKATQDALTSAISLISQGAAKAVELAAGNNNNSSGNAEITALRNEIAEMRKSLVDRETQQLKDELAELRTRVNNPSQPQRSEIGALSDTAKLLNVEDGAVGVVKAIAGTAAVKEEGFLDFIGKGVGEGLKTVLVEQGGNAIQAWREYTQMRREENAQRRGATPPPQPPAPAPQRPAAQPAAAPQAPQQLPGEPPQLSALELISAVTQTIRQWLLKNFDGGAVAEIVKDKFAPYMHFVAGLDIFKDFDKLLAFCQQNPDLREFLEGDDEQKQAFMAFAKEFWDEFQPPQPGAGQPATEAVN